jgi:hypothetical protein
MLWVDGPLSYLEQLCMVSFIEVGHQVRLYTYDNVTNIPDGVEVCDARSILPASDFVIHERTGSPAPQSDVFRYRLLAAEKGIIWADTDAYCLKPFEPRDGHYYGHLEGEVATGVLAIPPDSEALRMLLDYTKDPYSIPPWLPPRLRQPIEERQARNERVNLPETLWGVWGPSAFTWMLQQTGEIDHALPEHVFYPVSFKRRRAMARPHADVDQFMRPDTVSIHFYGRRMRAMLCNKYGGSPDPDSLVGRLVKKHGIDPEAAPIIRKVVQEPEESDA